MEENNQSSSQDISGEDLGYLIIPITSPHLADMEQSLSDSASTVQSILSGQDSGSSSSSFEESVDSRLARSTLSFHSVSDDPSETVSAIEQATGVSDEDITTAAKCGAFWKSLGAETLVYMASYGGGLLANGLIIRFAGLDPLLGTLTFGSYSGLSYHNARVLFTSLIKPAQDDLPEDKRETFQTVSKYAFLPASWIIGSAISGTALSLLGDDSFATQQAIGVPTSLMIGPVIGGLGALTRECMGGSIILEPDYEGYETVGEAFGTAYGSGPNPNDEGRSHRYGMARDVFLRFLSINLGTITSFALGATSLATYCIGGQEDFMNATANNSTADINELLNEHCAGGQFTFMFRELGFSVCYGLGVLVVEPLLGKVFNSIYDCFFQASEENSGSDSSGRVEDVTDEEV